MKTASLGLLEVIVVRAYFPGEGDVTALPCESSLLDMYIGRYVVRVGECAGGFFSLLFLARRIR